jgi:asparagine synthase (glutamine-hydrolysing)
MCGIAGFVGLTPLTDGAVSECLTRMRRRGPDAARVSSWRMGSGRIVQLLHTRLSIIDLDVRANQPFNIGSKWLAYNGELYNYLELRDALRRQGHTFRTESDTEVLLTLLSKEGCASLDRCEGMWAFAVYDEIDGSLLLCRDRFGEKPLYLFRNASGIYFGSEVKFIAALLGQRLTVNYSHVYRYLVNGYKALHKADEHFFEGIKELRPGSWLRIDGDGRETTANYWRPSIVPDDTMSYASAVEGARERLIQAVRIRLRADVPLAFCMSGGVDSNALLSIARRQFDYDVHGFTIVNDDARYEEQEMVDLVVHELDIRHTSVPARTDDFLSKLRTLVCQHDGPVYTISYFAHWMLMEAIAREGFRISISGTAADELFTGYYDHHLAYLYEIRSDPVRHAASLDAWTRHVRPIVRNPHLSNPNLFLGDPGFRDHIFLDASVFSGFLRQPWIEPFSEASLSGDLLRNRMLNELFHEAVPVILHEDDLNAMYYSVENRSPYLDRELFEFCFSIPTRHLIQDGRAKQVLRDAMRGIVPQPVLDSRRKVGFNAPILSFLDVANSETRAQLLDDGPIFEHVRRDRIEELLDKDFLPNSQSKFLFYFLNSKIFLEEYAA